MLGNLWDRLQNGVMMKILIFVGVIFAVLTLMKAYVYMRFMRHSAMINKWLGLGFLVLLATGEILLFVVRDSHFAHWQYLLVGSCVLLGYSLFLACLCVDMFRICAFLATKYQRRHSKHISRTASLNESVESTDAKAIASRRVFLRKIIDWSVATLFAYFSFKSLTNALSVPHIKEVYLKVPHLRRKMSIAMISDVHIGKTLGREFLEKVVARINALNVDIVVIVGDLVDDKIHLIKDDLEPLKDLQSVEGVYYVSGNHEYYHSIEPILAHLKTLNLRILNNTNTELENVNLVGVSDIAGEQFKLFPPDLNAAKQGINADKPSILLAHQPKFVRQNDVSEFDIVLCGHTHGGQVFPLSLLVWLDQHYIHGLYTLPNPKRTQLYVSSGVGFWGPAIRFLAPSEIVHLVLEGINSKNA